MTPKFFLRVWCALVEINGLSWKYSGPGLQNKVNLPVRYFYIEVVDNDEQRVDGQTLTDLEFEFYDKGGRVINCRKELGARRDGLLMFRFRWHFSNDGGTFVLHHEGARVFEKSFGPMLDESCNCPLTFDEFIDVNQCPDSFPQLDEDMAHFQTVDLAELAAAGNARRWKTEATIHYVIKDQQIYTKRLGTITDFKMFTDGILFSLLRKVKMPDMEFIFNVGDWPIEKNLVAPLPVFSWCGSNKTTDIVMPTWDQTKNTRLALNRVSVDILSVQQSSGKTAKWTDKIERALFRGRDSNKARLAVAELAQVHSDLLDAGLTSYNFRKIDAAKWGPKADFIPLTEMGEYKYQLLIDGTVAAYRAPYLFQTGSLIIKQKSDFYEWWYKYLVPGEHFIEMEKDASDVLEKIKWAKANDELAKTIAENGMKFGNKMLTPDIMYCYYAKALFEYSKKQLGEVRLYDDHEHVATDYDAKPIKPCACPTDSPKDEL